MYFDQSNSPHRKKSRQCVWLATLTLALGCSEKVPQEIPLQARINLTIHGSVKRMELHMSRETAMPLPELGEGWSIRPKSMNARMVSVEINSPTESREFDVTAKLLRMSVGGKRLAIDLVGSTIPPFSKELVVPEEIHISKMATTLPADGRPFRGHCVESNRSVRDQNLADSLHEALTTKGSFFLGGADCREPEFGVSFELDDRPIDVLFMFKCGWIAIYDEDGCLLYGFAAGRAKRLRSLLEQAMQ